MTHFPCYRDTLTSERTNMSTSNETTAAGSLVLGDVLRGRASAYRMFSRLFLKPLDEADIDELAAMDFVARSQNLEESSLLAEGFYDMGRDLLKRNTGSRQTLATDYTMCFDGVATFEGEVAVPYASVFLSEKALLYQEPRHEVFKLFSAEGISLKKNVKLPEDHLSFELEFLAVLSEHACVALGASDLPEARRNLELSRSFIHEHILTWFGLLSERADKLLTTRFYRGLMKAMRGYLELDLQTISEIMEELGDD